MISRLGLYIFSFFSVVALDQISKWYVLSFDDLSYQLNDYISFELALNRGIMSGIFHSPSPIIFFLVSLGITAFLLIFGWIMLTRYREGHSVYGEVLVLAGAFSNIIDRVLHGGVIDFIKLSYHQFVWPLFNLADAFIVLGVAVMLFFSEDTLS